jgi:hypothetical protein
MTELTVEIIRESDLRYSEDEETPKDGWLFIQKTLDDADDGCTYFTIVYKNVETGEYWAFNDIYNSWDDVMEEDDFQPRRVIPTEVLRIEYVDMEDDD